jgi:hypothetical protein
VTNRAQIQQIIDEAGLDDDGRACLSQIIRMTFEAIHKAHDENRDAVEIDFPEALKFNDLDPEMRRRVRFTLEQIMYLLRDELVV